MNGLKRVILIDSHMSGVVEMRVDKHTNICGTNAAGKTTLQRLIMVFYGESPSQVVPKTRDSFEKWYLPRASSFIVYEYKRESGQTCQAVLSSTRDGNSVQYHLINKPFDMEDYVKERNGNSCQFFTIQELVKHLSDSKVDRSISLGNKEYRAIIQNDKTLIQLLAKNKQLKSYSRQFSICDSNYSLRHIEKLVGAIHTKNGKMSSIKSMIASILEEDGVVPPSLTLKSNAINDWVNESNAIEELAKHRYKLNKVAHSNEQLIETESILIVDTGVLSENLTNIKNQLILLQEKHDELSQEKQNKDITWEQVINIYFETTTLLKNEIKCAEDETLQISETYSEYIDSGIEKAKEDINNIDAWRKEHQNICQQLKMVTKDLGDIETTYNDNIAKLKDRENTELKKYSSLLENDMQNKENLIKKHHSEIRKKEDEQREYIHEQELTFDQLIEKETKQIIHLKAQLEYAGLTEAEKTELLTTQNRIENTQKERIGVANLLQDAINIRNNAEKDRNEKLNNYHEECENYEYKKSDVEEAEKNLNPIKDTLLYYLRNENHNWIENIGKVIHPELLNRKDLKPEYIIKNNQTLYGLSLSTKEIELLPFTDSEQKLKSQLIQAEQILKNAQLIKEQAEKELQEANIAINEYDKKVLIFETQLLKTNKNIENIEIDIKEMNDRHSSQLFDRKDIIRDKIVASAKRKNDKESDKKNSLIEILSTQKKHLTEINIVNENIIAEINDTLNVTKKRLKQISIEAKNAISDANTLYQNILNKDGVDQKSIINLKKDKNDLNAKITKAESRIGEVNTYKDWLSRVYQKKKLTLLTETNDKIQRLNQIEREHDIQKVKMNETIERINSVIKEHGRNITNAREEIQLISDTGKAIRKLNLVIPNNISPQFKDITIREYIREIHERLSTFNELISGLDSDIAYFDRLIAKSGDGKIGESWDKAFNKFNQLEHNYNLHQLVIELQKIFNELIPQNIRSLRHIGQNFGIQFSAFYSVLRDIDTRIQNQKRKLTQNIDEDLVLDGVTDSGIRIFSKISELEYWSYLREFITHHEACSKTGYAEQPSLEYMVSIQNVAKLLSNNNRDNLSIIDLLDIELYLTEGKSKLTIRTDQELINSSSNGMAYLILCKYLLSFTNMIRGESKVPILWPIDELGTLHVNYIKKIFSACDTNKIIIIGALPNPDMNILYHFKYRYFINKQKKSLCVMESSQSRLMAKVEKEFQR